MSLKTSEVPPQDLQKDPVPTGLNAKECNQQEIVLGSAWDSISLTFAFDKGSAPADLCP